MVSSLSSRVCTNCRREFVIDPEDFDFYTKLQVPPPTFCPDCRKERRLAWRNDSNLFSRECGLCGKKVISIYAPAGPMKTVYCVRCWWSDGWDPKSYGREYDFSRPFFEQFVELQREVPALTMINDDGISSVNSEYTQDFARAKNCYMCFIGWKVEDSLYCYYILGGKDMVDAAYTMDECEYIYETVDVEHCYQSRYVYYSSSLSDCAFTYDCRDCSDCFMCVGLRHKRYCFKNEQYSKEDYEKILASYRLDTYSGVERAKKEFAVMLYVKPRRFAFLWNCVHCTGDALSNGKNSHYCFDIQKPEDCKWVENADTPKNCYDISVGGEMEQCYEGITPDNSYRSSFSIFSWKNQDTAYLDACHTCKDSLGCVGLKKGRYCILNKEYSKEEYEALLPKIKEHMDAMPYSDKQGVTYGFGEFFPSELSYFAYNESVAQDYFPLEREEAVAKGRRWQDALQLTTGKETMRAADLPDGISEVNDTILNEILACVECSRNYRIVPAELKFYRRMKIPLPRKCFYCRHKARLELRNPHRLWRRVCDCAGVSASGDRYDNTIAHLHGSSPCGAEFDTPYASGRPEIVYCDKCYQQEIE